MISPEEYLRMDRATEHRSEYVDGEVFAMSGGTRKHTLIIGEVYSEFRSLLKGSTCRPTTSGLRLQLEPRGPYFYPDVMVTCGAFEGDADDIATNPVVVVEVLSPSTERWDRTGKFAHYRQVPSLRVYMLVSQDEMRVEWWERLASGQWVYYDATGLEGECKLDALGVTLSLARIYENVGL